METSGTVGWLATTWTSIAWLGLVVALGTLWRRRMRNVPATRAVWLYRGLALLGFAVTWTFMLLMTSEDVARYPNFSAWLVGSNLFFDAYRAVSNTAPAWWISSQLMAWAMGALLFFHVGGEQHSTRGWPYLWLAMCVAVSVALPLFLIRILRTPSTKPPSSGARVPVALLASVAIASVCLLLTPHVTGDAFKLVMLGLHAPVLLAATMAGRVRGFSAAVPVRYAYVVVGMLSFVLHVSLTLSLLLTHGTAVIDVVAAAFSGNPALASIGSDLVLTCVICTVFVVGEAGVTTGILFAVFAVIGSVGAAFPLYLLWRERLSKNANA